MEAKLLTHDLLKKKKTQKAKTNPFSFAQH